ncbi:MAG: hypothetical protein Q8S22_05865 [Eubacteriales bacterium]|nr:hypothetical protein [Eubacteriales bacterium]
MEQNTCRESMLLSIYQECNEHAREQAKMRNSMITIYLALFAAYVGLLNGEKPISEIILYSLFGAMLFIGFLCIRATIDYRCWIIRYLSCARAVSSLLMQEDVNGSAADVSEKLRERMNYSKDVKKHTLNRMGNMIIVFFIIITSAPVVFLVDRLMGLSTWLKLVISTSYMILYSTTHILILTNQVKKADNEGGEGKYKKTPWIIDFY